MKDLNNFINESNLNKEGKIKNQACIDIAHSIGDEYVDKITSNENGKTWQIQLKGTGIIDLFELSGDIQTINKESKYNCINSIVLDYDKKTIIVE